MSHLSTYSINILDNILHGVIVTDTSGHILYWNDACKRILGYNTDEIIGKPIRILYDDDETMPFKKILKDCIEGSGVHGRWHALHKNGRSIWLDIRARIHTDITDAPEMCVISICDISKLKFTEQRLQNKRVISQAIFDTSLDAIITIDKSGRIESLNRTAETMFGYSEKELLGENIKVLMPFPYNINHDKYLKNYLKTGEKKILDSRREVHAMKKDGTIFPIDLGVTEIIIEGKRTFAGVIRDLSAQRELEKQLIERGNEERRKIGRELHDGLGQMLTGIRLLTESLTRKLQANALPGAEEVKEISEMITEADQYARSISQGMVQVDVEKRGLSVAIQNLCKQTTKYAGIECTMMESNEIKIENHTMAVHIYRIIQEAISNAIKHGKAHKVIIRLSQNKYHTSISIDDDGEGFNPDEIENKGIGLQIMKYRVGIMGGIFEIARTEEKMTRIQCIIPNNMSQF